jgi:transcription elongation factor GreA
MAAKQVQKQFSFTQEGLDELKAEYKILTETKHMEAIERLSRARAQGDLRENSEYHAAKEDLAVIVGRKKELEVIFDKAVVIQETKDGSIGIGKTVVIMVNGTEQTLHLVGELEANMQEKKISINSPIGKALYGKYTGDVVDIKVPAGTVTYTIKAVK